MAQWGAYEHNSRLFATRRNPGCSQQDILPDGGRQSGRSKLGDFSVGWDPEVFQRHPLLAQDTLWKTHTGNVFRKHCQRYIYFKRPGAMGWTGLQKLT